MNKRQRYYFKITKATIDYLDENNALWNVNRKDPANLPDHEMNETDKKINELWNEAAILIKKIEKDLKSWKKKKKEKVN